MKRLVVVALLGAIGGLPPQSAAQKPSLARLFTCAAFSRRGDLAEITVRQRALDLVVIRAAGTQQSSQNSVGASEHHFKSFFAADSDVLAITSFMGTDPGNSTVRVRIWNLKSAAWQSRFDVEPRPGLQGPLAIDGFWKGGPNLVVMGRRDGKEDTRSTWILLNPSGTTVLGPTDLKTPALIDARDNRAWVNRSGHLWGCSMRAIALIGEGVAGPSVKLPPTQAEDCTSDFFGFPDANTMVGAAGKGGNDGTWVWALDLRSGRSTKLLLPSPRKQFLDRWVESGPAELEVSPDGKFFGVDVQITRWSHFDTQRAEWSELHVFQASPFREIGKVVPIKGCRWLMGFAIGDADSRAHVAVNWCGKWSTETMSDVVAASHH